MATPRSRLDRKYWTVSGLFALWAAFTPAAASAEPLCQCLYPSLERVLCDHDLTARIKISASTTLRNGNRAYLAKVEETFRGEAGRHIVIEAPRGCGFEFRAGRRYLVSLNVDARTGYYTTWACTSFVSDWKKLSSEDEAKLYAPACAASCETTECGADETCVMQQVQCVRAPCPPLPMCVPTVVQEGEVCYRFYETDPSMSVQRECAEGLACVNTSETFGFNSTMHCVAAQSQDAQ